MQEKQCTKESDFISDQLLRASSPTTSSGAWQLVCRPDQAAANHKNGAVSVNVRVFLYPCGNLFAQERCNNTEIIFGVVGIYCSDIVDHTFCMEHWRICLGHPQKAKI